MKVLESLASRAVAALGPDSGVTRWLRPWWERFLYVALRGRGIEYEINGVSFRVDPRHRNRLGRAYDAPVAAFLRERVRPGATCVNVGANVGVYVLQLATWSAPDGFIVAFEPNPRAVKVLRRHVRMNRLGDRVEIVEAAVADQPGTADFHVAGVEGMGRLRSANPLLEGTAEVLDVKVTTLDEFVTQRGLAPDWVFMDIEGFEWHAIAGAERLIGQARRTLRIVVELHPSAWPDAGTSADEGRQLLERLGLTAVPLTGQADPLGEHGIVHLLPTDAARASG